MEKFYFPRKILKKIAFVWIPSPTIIFSTIILSYIFYMHTFISIAQIYNDDYAIQRHTKEHTTLAQHRIKAHTLLDTIILH